MAVEQVAQRFVVFLAESISTKVGNIDGSASDSVLIAEVKSHCAELQKAVGTLFTAESEQSTTNSRRGGRNGREG